ncbi:hypothetical protein [Pollutibacter soli]|uniref:hypothetical protein n=1 Tax=Pollutibacter soli TaxID=3034157 RepID=UPI003013FBC8
MRKHHKLLLLLLFCTCINACKKEDILPPFNETFTEPYTTGSIRFQFYKINPDRPSEPTKRQQVDFTATYENPDEWMCGYYRPDMNWTAMIRRNPANQEQWAGILFYNLKLDSIPLPFTFDRNSTFNAQLDYTFGSRQYTDASGNIVSTADGYSATSNYDDFTLTLLSKSNQRLQGTFTGILKNIYDGGKVKIEKGIFDVAYVVR